MGDLLISPSIEEALFRELVGGKYHGGSTSPVDYLKIIIEFEKDKRPQL